MRVREHLLAPEEVKRLARGEAAVISLTADDRVAIAQIAAGARA